MQAAGPEHDANIYAASYDREGPHDWYPSVSNIRRPPIRKKGDSPADSKDDLVRRYESCE